jgi:WD40 repeat protein
MMQSLGAHNHVRAIVLQGFLNIYDLGRANDAPVYCVKGHNGIINAIDGIGGQTVGYGAPELVTGGRDGCVRVWDPRVKEPVVSLEPDDGQTVRDCWTVAFGNSFSDEERVVAAGYDNGDVKIFDLRTNSLRYETNVKNGVTNIDFDRKDIEMNKFAVTTLESKFRVFDARTQVKDRSFHLNCTLISTGP